jgi:hypothetical protein
LDIMIDTSRTLEIASSPWKLLALSVVGVLMTAGSASVAFRLLPDTTPDSFQELAAYFGTLFFGLCTGLALWRLVGQRGPVITITPDGIRDTRVAAELIPWRAVQDISTWALQGQKVMVLAVDPAVESRLTTTPIARWSRGANRVLGADGLCITAVGLKIDYKSLLQTSIAYAEAARRAG